MYNMVIDKDVAEHRPTGGVNTPLHTNVYHQLGILRAWPGPATEVTCSRQAFGPGL